MRRRAPPKSAARGRRNLLESWRRRTGAQARRRTGPQENCPARPAGAAEVCGGVAPGCALQTVLASMRNISAVKPPTRRERAGGRREIVRARRHARAAGMLALWFARCAEAACKRWPRAAWLAAERKAQGRGERRASLSFFGGCAILAQYGVTVGAHVAHALLGADAPPLSRLRRAAPPPRGCSARSPLRGCRYVREATPTKPSRP